VSEVSGKFLDSFRIILIHDHFAIISDILLSLLIVAILAEKILLVQDEKYVHSFLIKTHLGLKKDIKFKQLVLFAFL